MQLNECELFLINCAYKRQTPSRAMFIKNIFWFLGRSIRSNVVLEISTSKGYSGKKGWQFYQQRLYFTVGIHKIIKQ